jgi:hypothetical protein
MDYYQIVRQQFNLENEAEKIVQQFKYEGSLIMKDNLAALLRETYGYDDPTQSQTFILDDHFPAFVGKFKENVEK